MQGVLRTADQHRRKRNELPHPCPRTMQEAARAIHLPRAQMEDHEHVKHQRTAR